MVRHRLQLFSGPRREVPESEGRCDQEWITQVVPTASLHTQLLRTELVGAVPLSTFLVVFKGVFSDVESKRPSRLR